jgi:YD repeat-containing protein
MKNYSFISIILLFCTVSPVFSQENMRDSLELITQASSCVNSYTNPTVSSAVNVYGCNTLSVQNVTVTGSGNLNLSAPNDITIKGPFIVQLSGRLNVVTEKRPDKRVIRYDYDNSGNRKRRSFNLEF